MTTGKARHRRHRPAAAAAAAALTALALASSPRPAAPFLQGPPIAAVPPRLPPGGGRWVYPLRSSSVPEEVEVDVAIVGAGIGGLCAGAILNTLYGKKVGIYEAHYLAGGCAHAFEREGPRDGRTGERGKTFTFDSGPTIVLGCSGRPYNPLRQVLNAVGRGDEVDWIRYGGWGMVERPGRGDGQGGERRWRVELGPGPFEEGPLAEYGGPAAAREFRELRELSLELVEGAVAIPAMAMRSGPAALVPLLRYFRELVGLIRLGPELTTGTFGPYMDGPRYVVTDPWLRDWLDALAFSLSGLPASRTSAAAMAYVLYDLHREGAALDYPRGGMGSIIDSLVAAVGQGGNGSGVHLRREVQSIDTDEEGKRFVGLTLKNGTRVRARDGIVCNVPVWSVAALIKNPRAREALNGGVAPSAEGAVPRQTWKVPDGGGRGGTRSEIRTVRPEPAAGAGGEGEEEKEAGLLDACADVEMTGSFLHLHLALDATGLDLDSMEAHYTVMDRGLGGDPEDEGEGEEGNAPDGPCGELNMIAVSNPCVLDRTLAPEGHIVVHAYGAGNEPHEIWDGLDRKSDEYRRLKEERSQVLWRAVESVIPDARDRVVVDLVGSPLTHERFLRRPRGTYGAATEDYLKDGSTGFDSLVLCGDGIFPGIGVPAVALSGASAANAMVNPLKQWLCLDSLKEKELI